MPRTQHSCFCKEKRMKVERVKSFRRARLTAGAVTTPRREYEEKDARSASPAPSVPFLQFIALR